MVFDKSTLQHLEEAVAALKLRDVTRGLAGGVRAASETDEQTLHRVFEEYTKICAAIYARASYDEREALNNRYPYSYLNVLANMLGEPPPISTARSANAEQTCAHCKGPCLLVPQ